MANMRTSVNYRGSSPTASPVRAYDESAGRNTLTRVMSPNVGTQSSVGIDTHMASSSIAVSSEAVHASVHVASGIASGVASSLPERAQPAVGDASPPAYAPHDVTTDPVPPQASSPDAAPSQPALPASSDSLRTAHTHVSTPCASHRIASRSPSPAGSASGQPHSLSPTLRQGVPVQSFYAPARVNRQQQQTAPGDSQGAPAVPAQAGAQDASSPHTAADGQVDPAAAAGAATVGST